MTARGFFSALIVATALAASVGCGQDEAPPGGDTPAGPPGPTVVLAAPPAEGAPSAGAADMPAGIAADGSHLVSASGDPVYLLGDAAWSLIVQLSPSEAARYARDRHDRGFNAVLVNLVEHRFADDPPRTRDGIAPFGRGGSFADPNDAYFDRAADLVATLGEHDLLVLLVPAYLGYDGGDEGWFADMESADPGACGRYGGYVGRRFRGARNVLWVAGGDYSPPDGRGAACLRAIMDAIRETDPDALMTGHWAPETTSLTQPGFEDLVRLNGVYTYGSPREACGRAIADYPDVPTFLFETTYENEHGIDPEGLRRQYFESLPSCRAGFVGGARPTWYFGDGWEEALGSPGSLQLAAAAALVRSLDWRNLVEDSAIAGPTVALRAPDWGEGLLYFAPEVNRDGRLAFLLPAGTPALSARLVDPVTGSAGNGSPVDAGGGRVTLVVPADNAGGDRDWLVVLARAE